MKPRGPTRARKHGPPESHRLVSRGGAGAQVEGDVRRRWTKAGESVGDPAEMRRILDLPAIPPFRAQDLLTEITCGGEGPGKPGELRRRGVPTARSRMEPISPTGG
jgi:hypothetical protein